MSIDSAPEPAPRVAPDFDPDAPEVVEFVGERVTQFVAAWEHADDIGPPEIDEFLPDCPQLSRLVLIELVKVDLECRWSVFELPKRLEEYCEEFPVLRQLGPPAEVLYVEYQQRELVGEDVSVENYQQHYPEQAERFQQLVDFHRSPATVSSAGMQETLDDFFPGDLIGDYQLLMPLGKGAFARVFLARQKSIQRLVALKISLDHGSEGQTLAQFDHDYIVRVFHQETLAHRSIRLLCMQYLPGGTLQSVVRRVRTAPPESRNGTLLLEVVDQTLDELGENKPTDSSTRKELARRTWPEVVAWIGSRLADGLAYAHSKGVLHRDIKPANVLLTAEGTPKLADFNISFSESGGSENPTAYFGGSLAYMSPEHLEAFHPELERTPDSLDHRADMYSLAVMLWEMLTGRRPFVDENQDRSLDTIEEMLALRQGGVTEASRKDLPEDVPAMLRRVLLKALHPDRESRWGSLSQFSKQLRVCLEPHARELLDPPERGWSEVFVKRAVLIVLALNLAPNAVAAVCNFLLNEFLLRSILNPQAFATFHFTSGVVNGIAFPLGIGAVIFLACKVRCEILHAERQRDVSDAEDCLLLGDRCAKICLALWTVAGVAYPIILDMVRDDIPRHVYALFIFSLVISGLFATAYPYFGVTWFSLHYLYPALLRDSLGTETDRLSLSVLTGKTKFYLGLAAAIPLLAIFFLRSPELGWMVQAVCIVGMFAFWLAFKLQGWIERDIAALSRLVVREGEELGDRR